VENRKILPLGCARYYLDVTGEVTMKITFNVNNIQTPDEREALQRSQNLMKEIHNRADSLMGKDNEPGFDSSPVDGFVEFKDPDKGAGSVLFDPKTRELKAMDTFDGYSYVKFQKNSDAPDREELYYELAQTDENADPDATLVEKVLFNKGNGTITYMSNF
jgi:hypothetical protein